MKKLDTDGLITRLRFQKDEWPKTAFKKLHQAFPKLLALDAHCCRHLHIANFTSDLCPLLESFEYHWASSAGCAESDILQFLTGRNILKRLDMRMLQNVSDVLLNKLPNHCPELEELVLDGKLNGITSKGLFDLVAALPRLRILVLQQPSYIGNMPHIAPFPQRAGLEIVCAIESHHQQDNFLCGSASLRKSIINPGIR